MERCGWVSQDPLYIAYHDNEWGVPETDSKKLFEMICLEAVSYTHLDVYKRQDPP